MFASKLISCASFGYFLQIGSPTNAAKFTTKSTPLRILGRSNVRKSPLMKENFSKLKNWNS